MNIIKKMLLSCLIFILSLGLIGCGSANAKTSDEFSTLLKEKNYSINDITSQYSQYNYIESVHLAVNNSWAYQIEFFVFNDDTNAKYFFSNNSTLLKENTKGKYSNTSISTSNYENLSLETDTTYSYVSRVKNTALYVNTDKTYKEEIKKIIDELEY